jgi:hypothetical protein
MWKYVQPSKSSTATGRFVPNWSSHADALNFMASLAEMAGKDSPRWLRWRGRTLLHAKIL